MIIGIDGKPLTTPYPNGLKHYAENLLFHLGRIDDKNTYLIYASKRINIPLKKNFKLKIIDSCLPWQLAFPKEFRKDKVDILHVLQQHGPLFIFHPKTIVTMHDWASLSSSYPHWYESIKFFLLKCYVGFVRRKTMERAETIIAISKFTAQEVDGYFGNKKIYMIYQGVSHNFHIQRRDKEKSVGRYFLVMADFSPRKNVERILEAYSLLPILTRKKFRLKIIVSMTFPIKKINAISDRLSISDDIDILENTTLGQLVTLYNQAECFIYCSLYEGFGLPILEAMACGTPVITSNRGAMAEVASNAAYCINPESIEDISEAMKLIVTNRGLVNKLKVKGLERAKLFTWEETARKTLQVYEKVYKAQNCHSS